MANIAEITAIPGTRFCTSLELEAMTERLPVEQSLGGLYKLLKSGELRPGYGEVLFTELGVNLAAKRFLGELLDYAVQRDGSRRGYYPVQNGLIGDSWVGYNFGWQPRMIDHINESLGKDGAVSQDNIGKINARNEVLLQLVVLQDKVYAIPTKRLIEYARDRIEWIYSQPPDVREGILKNLMRDTTPSRK